MIRVLGEQACRTVLAAFLGFVVYYYFQWSQGYWVVLSAVLLVQIRSGSLFWQHVLWLVVAGVLSATTACLASVLAPVPIVLAIFLMITTGVCAYFGAVYPAIFLVAFMINFFGTLTDGVTTALAESAERFLLILLGAGFAVVASSLCWPKRRERDIRVAIVDCLQALDQLQCVEFAIYADRAYPEKPFAYERFLHHETRRVFLNIQLVRKLLMTLQPEQQAFFQTILSQIEKIYALILGLGSLRYQVSDHTTFGVVNAEFAAIKSALSQLLNQVVAAVKQKKVEWSSETFLTAIQAVDDVNRSALQVVAGEPIVFLLFIDRLNELAAEITQLQTVVQHD